MVAIMFERTAPETHAAPGLSREYHLIERILRSGGTLLEARAGAPRFKRPNYSSLET